MLSTQIHWSKVSQGENKTKKPGKERERAKERAETGKQCKRAYEY